MAEGHPEDPVVTVEGWTDAVAKFTAWMQSRERSAHTLRTYLPELAAFAAWYPTKFTEEVDPRKLTNAALRAWKTALVEGGLKPASVNKKLSAVGSFATWAERMSICRRIERPVPIPQQTSPPRWLTVNEEHSLVRAVEAGQKVRDIALITLLLNVGLRVSEAAWLPWDEIECTERKGKVRIFGKRGKWRTVPLNLGARRALEELRAISPDWRQPGAKVFQGSLGQLTTATLWRDVRSYAHPAKINGLSPHMLRHTFCRRLHENGVDIAVIATLAGHDKLDTTMKYIRPGEEDLNRDVEKLPGGCGEDQDTGRRPRKPRPGRGPQPRP
jgi:site-specific recombinase XerD